MAQTKNQTLTAQLRNFSDYLSQARNCSLPTRQNYHFYLKRFLKHGQIRRVNQINGEKIKNYKQWLAKQGLKKNTINYHLIALRSFLKYLENKKIKTLSPKKIILGQQPRFQRAELTRSEMTRLLNAPSDAREKEIIKLRDRALLETLEATSLKVSELVSLKRSDCQNRYEKKNKIHLSQQARHYIKKYLDKRMDSSPYLFIAHDRANGKKQLNLTSRSVQRLIKKYAQLAKIHKPITPETFRQPLKNN